MRFWKATNVTQWEAMKEVDLDGFYFGCEGVVTIVTTKAMN